MKRSTYNKPHNKLRFITPDQVAETWDGVNKDPFLFSFWQNDPKDSFDKWYQ